MSESDENAPEVPSEAGEINDEAKTADDISNKNDNELDRPDVDASVDNVPNDQLQTGQAQVEGELYRAICADDRDTLEELISSGADVDTIFEDYSGVSTKSLLHICCEKGRLECVRILLEHNAYVNMRDSWGQSPLMYCMITQYPEIAELLLSKDPDIVDHQDRFGKTALHCAVESGSVIAVELLLRHNADVCRHTSEGVTPVMTAVSKQTDDDNIVQMLEMMIKAGYDLEMKDFRSKRTALQMAVVAKYVRAVEVLLSAGANVDTMDAGWRTPLTNAIYQFARKPPGCDKCVVDPDGLTIIVMLTQRGSDLNMTLVESCNPLIACALVDSPMLAQYFLENGSNIDVQFDPSGATPLIVATTRNNIDVLKSFLRWNCNLTPKGHIQRRRVDYFLDAFELSVFVGHFEITRILARIGYGLQNIGYLRNSSAEEVPPNLRENLDLLHWLQEVANTPTPLTLLCIFCIREAIGLSVESKTSPLPVPPKIQNLINFTDILGASDDKVPEMATGRFDTP